MENLQLTSTDIGRKIRIKLVRETCWGGYAPAYYIRGNISIIGSKPSVAIVIFKYQGKQYSQVYDFEDEEFVSVSNFFKFMKVTKIF